MEPYYRSLSTEPYSNYYGPYITEPYYRSLIEPYYRSLIEPTTILNPKPQALYAPTLHLLSRPRETHPGTCGVCRRISESAEHPLSHIDRRM